MPENGPRFREYRIHPGLAGLVTSIWSLEGDIGEILPQRIVPDTCVEVVIHFCEPFHNRFGNGPTALQPQSFVVGQMRQFLDIEPSGRSGFVAVRLPALHAYRFFRAPLTEITNSVVDLEEIWDGRGREYTERIDLARDMPARIRIVEEMLSQALRRNDRHDLAVEQCIRLIENAGDDALRIGQLASVVGLSTRQLGRRFERAVGVTPKQFLRLKRFVRAARRLRERAQNFTRTAYDCAYFDQAHFNHDFRHFSDMTPSEFVASDSVVI